MHHHPEHKKRELEHIQLTVEGFDALSPVQQQQMRSKSWKAFQDGFSPAELDYALELFAEKGKGDYNREAQEGLQRSDEKPVKTPQRLHRPRLLAWSTTSNSICDQLGLSTHEESHRQSTIWGTTTFLPAPKANMSSTSTSSSSSSSPAAALTGLPSNNDRDKVATQARQLMRELLDFGAHVLADCRHNIIIGGTGTVSDRVSGARRCLPPLALAARRRHRPLLWALDFQMSVGPVKYDILSLPEMLQFLDDPTVLETLFIARKNTFSKTNYLEIIC
ncbi:hypothetical protein FIBSPDRAFT_887220 [Athelia psychrophila]|uniref:Uncharacterized protein n=1 Tax=Athelia psychrophila TaxID=1759441 RepID=A0A166PT95_9AGAM|nr:hypothetical protein FIBSPDRAFT_887220 [Fibularhizoctonia sp. CBS 109695]